MHIFWGVVLIIFTMLVCWLGQTITVFSPKLALKLGLTDSESDVDSTYYTDGRGEAIWDIIILWTLPVAGVLLILNNTLWAYFGLVGGGSYLYFAGRGIAVRLAMQHRGIRIGAPGTLKFIYFFLILWGLIAVVTIIMAISALPLI
ncbi:hypothetical protein ACFLUZ_00150 [Chloroflexota bacterium]